ncbi:MAG: DUF559 domain-containing protein [Solirubrobacteraceae bacterium]
MVDTARKSPLCSEGEVGKDGLCGIDPYNRALLVPVLGQSGLLRVSGRRDERIAGIAAVQRGRVRRSQLLAAGVTRNMIETMLENGRMARRYRGVYVVGHAAPAELTRETEALLACPDGTLLSHEAGFALWGLRPPLHDTEPIDITVAGARTPRHPGIRAHRTSTLARRDIRIRHRLPVTSPARTFVDVAGERSEYELERALDDALQRDLLRLSQLADALARAPGNLKGAGNLNAILADRQQGRGLSRSDAELILKRAIVAAGLPIPELNANFGRYQPDMVWTEQRLIVEVDSWRWHGSRHSFEGDRKRDGTLIAQGWTILRFTARQIEREPYRVIATIAVALARAAA